MSSSWSAIFDWDGVILNSSRQHEQAWQDLAREEGRALSPGFFRKSFGMKNDLVIRQLLGWTHDPQLIQRLNLRKEALFRERLRQTGVTPLPGVLAWLEALRAERIACAIASSTPRLNIECAIGSLGVEPYFTARVAGEDVVRGKPDPEVFLLAARKLNTAPDRCVVFEDAHVGIEAALAAGMKVVAVTTTHPAESLQRAHRVVQRLDQLRVAEINRWFAPGGA